MSNHLLHIDTSLRAAGSRSRRLSARFAEAWRHAHPDGVVTYRDLAANPLPHLDEAAFSANVIPEHDRTFPTIWVYRWTVCLVGRQSS